MIATNTDHLMVTMTPADAVRALIDGMTLDPNGPARSAPSRGDMALGIPRGMTGHIPGAALTLLVEPEDEEAIVDRFTSGNCAAFAHALWLVNGRDPAIGISVLVDEDEDPHSEAFPHCHTHVYVDTPDAEWDVEGRRPPEEMADAFSVGSWSTLGPYEPEEFRRTFCGDEDEPLYCDDDEIARAIAHIRSNPQRYALFQGDQA